MAAVLQRLLLNYLLTSSSAAAAAAFHLTRGVYHVAPL